MFVRSRMQLVSSNFELKAFVLGLIDLAVGNAGGLGYGEALRAPEVKCRYALTPLGVHAIEVRSFHLGQDERRAQVRLVKAHGDVIELDAIDVSDEETVGGRMAEHGRLGICVFLLCRAGSRQFLGPAACAVDADVL